MQPKFKEILYCLQKKRALIKSEQTFYQVASFVEELSAAEADGSAADQPDAGVGVADDALGRKRLKKATLKSFEN